jgi:hypothetical protein
MENKISKGQFLKLINESWDMDMDEMARAPKYPHTPSEQTIEIHPEQLKASDRTVNKKPPLFVSVDPETGEKVSGILFVTQTFELGGHRMVRTNDYSEINTKNGKPGAEIYIDLDTMTFYRRTPQNAELGTTLDRSQMAEMDLEQLTKRRIFPLINGFFEKPEIKKVLTSCLIPPIVGSPAYISEKLTNKELTYSFGGKAQETKFQIRTKYTFADLYQALEEISSVRMGHDAGDSEINYRKILGTPRDEVSKGRWNQFQSIYSKKLFKQHGEFTPILKLLKKNIDRGGKSFSTSTITSVNGGLNGDTYGLDLYFKTKIGIRLDETENVDHEVDFVPTIHVSVRKRIPEDADPETFKPGSDEKFVTSLYSELLNKLGDEILGINKDDVLGKIIDLFTPENLGLREDIKKKIVLTEEQVKMVISKTQKPPVKVKLIITEQQLQNVIKNTNNPAQNTDVDKEEGYDDAITKFVENRDKEISMPAEAAEMLLNFGKDWCEGRPNHPDCQEIDQLRAKLKM